MILCSFQNIYGQKISNRKFKKIISKEDSFDGAIISAVFVDKKKNKSIVDYQSNRYMTPVSNIKLFTFLAAISFFDKIPSIEYIKKGKKFYFRSTGYPLFGHPKFEDKGLAEFLKKQSDTLIYLKNKNKITPLGPGWAWDDQEYYFSSERSFFPFHGNVVKAYKKNKNGALEIFPKYFMKNKNLIKKIGTWNDIDSMRISDTLFIPFLTNKASFEDLVSEYLDKKVLSTDEFFEKSIKFKTFYSGFENQIYKALLHNSDNLIAESLLLMISNHLENNINIKKTIGDFVSNNFSQINKKPLWYDGSGLSRYNLVTSSSIIYVLKKIHEKIGLNKVMFFFPEINARSKKMSFFNEENEFKIFAKTGSLRNNHCLSGYLVKNEKLILFSFMVNHHNKSLSDIQEAIGKVLIKISKRI